MKINSILFLLSLVPVSLRAQLSHSRWKGTVRGDNPRNVIMDFRKDTVVLLAISDSSIVETMTYSIKDSILIL